MVNAVPIDKNVGRPHVRLRQMRLPDAALLALYASDRRVADMTTNIPHPYPPGTAEAYIARVLSPGGGEKAWAIDAGEEGENGLVGVVRLKLRTPEMAEIDYWVAPAFWGSGYASGAVAAAVGEARLCGLDLLTAQVFQDNAASIRVLLRCGFAYAGDGAAFSVARGGMVSTHCYRRALARD